MESSLLLDLADGLSKQQLREFYNQGLATKKSDARLPDCHLKLRTGDDQLLGGHLYACRLTIEGEDLVEVYLETAEDHSLRKKISALPWKLYLSVVCLLAITILPNLILPRLNINNTPSTFLPPDAPAVVLNKEVREIFPDDEVIVLLFEGVALYSDGFLKAYDELAQALLLHENIVDVIGLTTQDHIKGSEEGFLVEPLVNIENLGAIPPAERKQHILSDRFARNSLISSDGSALAMIVIPEALDNSILNLGLQTEVFELAKKYKLDGYLKATAGEIAIDVEQTRMVLRDNMIFIPATVFIGLLLTWVLFHRWIAVFTTGLVSGAVVNSTIAFYVIFDQPFNTISGIIPPLLSALTIAALVHFYNAMHYASRRGLVGKKRVDAALGEIRRPAFFSALTTSVGLASLGLSPIPPISIFGLASAAGVFLIYLVVIYIVPPIFMHFDNAEWPSRKSGLALMDKAVGLLFHTGMRKPVWVIGALVILLGAGIPNLLKITSETNVLEFFPKNHVLRQNNERIEAKLVGTTPLEVVFRTDESEGLISPEFLNYLSAIQKWLENKASVDKTISIADFVEEMHWGFHTEQPEYRVIPEDADLISQYLFVYDGEDIFDFIDQDYQIARLALNVNVHGANQISELMNEIRQYLLDKPMEGVRAEISGAGRMFADQEDLLIDGQVKSLSGAILVIFLLMLLLWRSLTDALLSMIPNLSPILLIFMIMGMAGIHLDLATAMIASVAVGIAIDDTIHVYHGYLQRVKRGISPVVALARTYRQAGRAVMTTSVILCAQFLLLLASAFVPMGNFGLLVSAGLVAALVFDLLLLPAILILLTGNTLKTKGPTKLGLKSKTA